MTNPKEEIRATMLIRRKELKPDEVRECSKNIQVILNQYLENADGPVHIFGAMTSRNEVNTWPLILKFWKNGLPVWMPVIKPDKSLAHAPVANETDLDDSHPWGLIQPHPDLIQPVPIFSLIVVPGLAFDHSGHRVGYGKGYYDQFLSQQKQAMKIGICFDFQLVEKLPITENDVPVNRIITESRELVMPGFSQ